MDAKTQELSLLAALSLFCAGFAWSWGHPIFAFIFFALAVIASGSAAYRHWR